MPAPDREPAATIAYVFGYGSLAELTEPLLHEGRAIPPLPGRLRGWRRLWGAAMNNWETAEDQKHFLDPDSGLKPRIRVAYLDVEEREGATVNGLAIPVDEDRLAELDRREINYRRIDVSDAFEPGVPQRVFTYVATAAARERCRDEALDAAVQVSREYVERVRRAFAAIGPDALAEFERTTEPLPFPQRELELRYPRPPAGT